MLNDSDATEVLSGLDQRIVAALQISPRAGVAEVGRILGEHERSVSRHLQRLLDTGAVRCTAEYDRLRCGLGPTVRLRLKAPTSCLKSIVQELANRPDVLNVAAVGGAVGHLWCELLLESHRLLYSLTTDGIPGLPEIDVRSSHVTLRPFLTEAEWHAPVLTEEEEKRLRASLVKPLPDSAHRYELTPTDLRVADALMKNGRISLTDLGSGLGVSTATAGRRVTALLERRVLHLRTVVDPALLGRPVQARVRLKVHPAGLEEVGSALAASPAVRSCVAVTGRHNLLADVCVEHETSLYSFVVDTLGALPHILAYDTDIIRRLPPDGPAPRTAPR
ncbi:Lrp/AsnC family transcriptional regulator [Streptomyces griseoviridis]|uniref:Lrp/AsnC family transcriptional regulator n=2 Tax=Streptomyces TaxID=1883 RepID=A0A3S9ZBV9_STRGD|nr:MULTISPECIES: Lrp/AsnC family transcriptional regulator [Streptomyces]AZS85291.1 Lrp/AsnC family transcriptional regulator [Streptomyces griseoviridis]MDH6702936.1 DNA-binding Lrp family transcriptional regulator [Streptomyces sp. MAA16]MDT0477096.1 Lrp/AsnC family transcriptional regulator [Streptomyces sp. DSM 41014]QCN87856.1 Lrp/AsnC family transcriptional regulator [Streptomyces griseoviridis]